MFLNNLCNKKSQKSLLNWEPIPDPLMTTYLPPNSSTTHCSCNRNLRGMRRLVQEGLLTTPSISVPCFAVIKKSFTSARTKRSCALTSTCCNNMIASLALKQQICTIRNSSADPADPADQVSRAAARNHPSMRAGCQDDAS